MCRSPRASRARFVSPTNTPGPETTSNEGVPPITVASLKRLPSSLRYRTYIVPFDAMARLEWRPTFPVESRIAVRHVYRVPDTDPNTVKTNTTSRRTTTAVVVPARTPGCIETFAAYVPFFFNM